MDTIQDKESKLSFSQEHKITAVRCPSISASAAGEPGGQKLHARAPSCHAWLGANPPMCAAGHMVSKLDGGRGEQWWRRAGRGMCLCGSAVEGISTGGERSMREVTTL